MKLLWLHFLWVLTLFSCASPYESHVPVKSNFPLQKIQIFSADDVIERIALSDTWMAVYTSGTATAIELETKETLWKTNLTIQAADPLAFVIVGDALVATSAHQVLLIDKLGQKKKLTLESADEDNREIIRVAAVYPDTIYINRSPDWELEAYSLSQNAKLWSLSVGRGSTDIFYDANIDVAYITTRYGSFFAVDNTTGEVLWKHGGRTLTTIYEDGVIYSVEKGSNSRKIRFSAFDVESQTELWESEVTFSPYVYDMTIINDLVIVNGDAGLLAVKKSDGSILWQTAAGESFATKPVEYDGRLFAKGTSHTVYAISPQNGDFLGYISLESNKPVQPMYEVISGVYKVKDGIVFNTRHDVLMYKHE